ncbi:MAG: hypothetical protein H6625_05290 [Bdellovibrionaceae bacterium]|nr:hypothetical protein [Pseudobdellovibrionaceae bacterium]
MFKVILITFCIVSTGCSSWKFWEKDSANEPSAKQKAEEKRTIEIFSEGNKYLDQGKYLQAKEKFEKALSMAPATSFELLILFNLAAAYEGLGDCKAAGRNYRKVVNMSGRSQQRLQSESLYSLSKAYECIGSDEKVIASLVDLEKRKQWLSQEVAYAEIPARLAITYSRKGNTTQALKYFKEAEKGLSKISNLRMEDDKKKELLARTLYTMGGLNYEHFNEKNYDKYLKSLDYVQKYLLRSVELDHKNWSPRSAEALLKSYEGIWKVLGNIKDPSSDAERNKKVEFIKETLTSLELLKRSRFPGAINQEMVIVLFDQLHKKEVEFQNYLAENSNTTQKTKENEKRFGIKREGKLVVPKK